MQQGFLRYANGRWWKAAAALSLFSLLLYVLHDPGEPRNGGTWVGYTLGTIAALLILWLTWYGVRKRDYRSQLGTVQGWLSAHVYLCIALLFIATLHAGFQLGWNVHTLAWVLMVLVIASGLFGVVVYRRLPSRITINRADQDRAALLREISTIDRRCRELADAVGMPVSRQVQSAIDRFEVGGGLVDQLLARDRSQVQEPQDDGRWQTVRNARQARLLSLLAGELSRSDDAQRSIRLQELIDQVGHKRALASRLANDIRMQGLLQVWLYLHVPLTVALLMALVAHVVAVFFYW